MSPADPAATLEAIKERHRQHVSVNFPEPGICVSRCSDRWPCEAYRAASAVVAVLKLADDDDLTTRFFRERSPWTIALREAITRALNGDTDA